MKIRHVRLMVLAAVSASFDAALGDPGGRPPLQRRLDGHRHRRQADRVRLHPLGEVRQARNRDLQVANKGILPHTFKVCSSNKGTTTPNACAGKGTPADRCRQDGDADRHVRQGGQVRVPLHDSCACAERHEGRAHRHLVPSDETRFGGTARSSDRAVRALGAAGRQNRRRARPPTENLSSIDRRDCSCVVCHEVAAHAKCACEEESDGCSADRRLGGRGDRDRDVLGSHFTERSLGRRRRPLPHPAADGGRR